MLLDTILKYSGEIANTLISAVGGSLLTVWAKKKKGQKEHDRKMFEQIDALLPEETVKKIVEDAKSTYNIFRSDAHGISGLDRHWEKESSKFIEDKLNALTKNVSESGIKLLEYFTCEGEEAPFEKFGGRFYTVYFQEYQKEPIDHQAETRKLWTEVKPKVFELAQSFENNYSKFRKEVKKTLHC